MDFSEIFGFALPFLDKIPFIRALLGFVIVFILPGLAWTLFFFKNMNIIERLALSFGLSIAVATLSIIVLHVLLGVTINGFNSLLTILVIVIIPLVCAYLKKLITSHSSREP
jgi:uncharacterized membrane protein